MAAQKDTRQLILDTITDIIAEEGVEAVTFSNIAQRSFLNKGGIAYYFENKSDMFREYYRYFFDRINDAILDNFVECNKNRNPVEAFCRFVRSEVLDYGFRDELSHRVINSIFAGALKDEVGYVAWREFFVQSLKAYEYTFGQYAEQGILDMKRYDRTLTAFHLVTSSLIFKLVYRLDMWDSSWHEREITEWLIRNFLKDEYVPGGVSKRAVVKKVRRINDREK